MADPPPFDPSKPYTYEEAPKFDPSKPYTIEAPPTLGQRIGNLASGVASGLGHAAIGVGRGLAGDVLGASQLATDLGVPTSPDDPIEKWLKGVVNKPSTGTAETVGRAVGGGLPFLTGNPIIAGGAAGVVQPTPSGDLSSHLTGGGIGAAAGGLLGALGGSKAVRAMHDLGVRITPGRLVPLIGREWERFAARLPVLNRMIGHGRQVSLDDFQRALYRDALEPLGGQGMPSDVGAKGLDQLFTTVTGRLNNVLSRSSVQGGPGSALEKDLATIQGDAFTQLNDAQLRRFQAIIKGDVTDPLVRNSWTLSGQRLAGGGGVVGRLGAMSRQFWERGQRSGDSQEAALGDMVKRVQTAILDNANIGGGGRAELDAARNAYARYSTLARAGSGVKAEGKISPDDLLGEIRRGHRDQFARGQLRVQPMAQAAKKAGVPTVAEAEPTVSPWETLGLFGGLGAAAHYLNPEAIYGLAGLSPSLLYNKPAMSVARTLSRTAPRAAPVAGAAAGQVTPSMSYSWPSQ